MSPRLAALLQEAEQQRSLAAIGQLAAGIAHDFNNIIGATVLHTEILRNEPALGVKVHARLDIIIDQLQRASRSDPTNPRFQPTDDHGEGPA